MKHKLFALCALAALSTQAAVVNFQISPAGSDSAVGLSSTNEVPAVTSSTGSGGTFSAGILLDTDTAKLTLAVAYGFAGGFTDLTGPATGWRIHGPAPAGQNAPAVIDLAPYVFLSATPEKGGLIVGEIAFPAATVPDLLAGRYYLNIETEKNTSGEIRGQLIATGATNLPPSVSCPGPITVECPAPAQVTVLVSDPEGDALTAVWSVNGAPLQTNTLAAPSAPANLSFVWSLPLGTNVIAIVVTDSAGNSASCSSIVTVVDTVPPVITSVVADHTSLWPPNHQMVPIKLDAAITDACGPVTWKIVSVTSNEPVNDKGDGNTAPDWRVTGDHTLKLRAERSGKGDGRVYSVTVQATDAAGNLSAMSTVTVSVPKSQGNARGNSADGNDRGNDNSSANGNGKNQGKGNGRNG